MYLKSRWDFTLEEKWRRVIFMLDASGPKKNEKIGFPFSAVGECQKLREGPRTRQGTFPKHSGAPGSASGHPAEKWKNCISRVKWKFTVSPKIVFRMAVWARKTLKGYIHPRWGCICAASASDSLGQRLVCFRGCPQQVAWAVQVVMTHLYIFNIFSRKSTFNIFPGTLPLVE